MDRIGDAFVWPVRDPEWLSKVLIHGAHPPDPDRRRNEWMGWMLATSTGCGPRGKLPARQFSSNLAEASSCSSSFSPITSGFPGCGAPLRARHRPSGEQGRDSSSTPLVLIGLGLLLLGSSFITLASLALTFATTVDRVGLRPWRIAGGVRIDQVGRRATASLINTLIAGLMLSRRASRQLGQSCALSALCLRVPMRSRCSVDHRSFELGGD